MSRLATARTRPRRSSSAAEPAARTLGHHVEDEFRKAAAQAVEDAHVSGVPVAVLTDDNQVAWLHPDGIVRATREPVHGTRIR